MQEEEFKEILKEVIGIMLDEMDKMQKQIEVLNEKQNGEINTQTDSSVPGRVRAESDKQIPFTGL